MGIQMPRVKDDHVKSAELTAGLNKAREVGDIAEMWRCAAELMVMDQDRPAKRGMPKASADQPSPVRGQP
jgi:hypothetical protein